MTSAFDTDPIGVGHNQGPALEMPPITAALAKAYADMALRAEQLTGSAGRAPKITTDDIQANVATLAGQMHALIARLEVTRAKEKKPFLDGGRQVDTWFNDLSGTVEDARSKLVKASAVYLKSKEPPPSAVVQTSAPERVTVRSDAGASVSLTAAWGISAIDMATVDLNSLRDFIDSEAVAKAMRAWMKAHKTTLDVLISPATPFAGVTLTKEAKANFRR